MPPDHAAPPATDALVARLRAAGCVFAEDEAALLLTHAPDPRTLEEWTMRRVAGEPLEVVLGFADLAGVRVRVAPGVFVPRQRSALLIDAAVAHLRTVHAQATAQAPATVVDLCCGTGALGLAVALAVPGISLHAADLDPVAVACATSNLAQVGGRVHLGDLDAPLPRDLRGAVDVLIANAPYVPTSEIGSMPPEAREHEPTLALDGGADGLALARRVMAVAPLWLSPHGLVIVECAAEQADTLADAARATGLIPAVLQDDDLGATAVRAARPAAPRRTQG